MTYRRCQNCSLFYDKKEPVCAGCGTPPYGFSKPLVTGKLNGHLYEMARSADREAKFARARGLD